MGSVSEASEELIRFTNVKPGESIYHRLLLIVGRAGTPDRPVRSIVAHPDPRSGFESIEWQVNQSHFKATVPLREGDNVIRFVPNFGTKDDPHEDDDGPHEVKLPLKYEPQDVPPLRIVILLAKDSPVDIEPTATVSPTAVAPTTTHTPFPEATPMPKMPNTSSNKSEDGPARTVGEQEGPSTGPQPLVDCPPGPIRDKILAGGIKEIQRRVAVQAYCWQAFYAEQMHRHRLGRRSFRLEEHPRSENGEDNTKEPVRLEDLLVVHLVRSDKTRAEFHDANNAQQNKFASNSGAMWDWANEALSKHPTLGKSRAPIAVLTLESHWVVGHRKAPPANRKQQAGLILGHAALGGWSGSPWASILEERQDTQDPNSASLSVGVMGSHWIWSAPSSLSQLTEAFLDETKTDERYVVSDLGEGGTAWETFCVGMGAWLHEAGHALGNPHWPSGIMSRGYNEFSRIFTTTEGYRTRLDKPGERLITPANDDLNCHLHRAEAFRARWHPNFRLPGDLPAPPTLDVSDPASVEAWKSWSSLPPVVYATPKGALFQAAEGNEIVAIEIDIDDKLARLIEFTGRPAGDGAREGEAPVIEYLLDKKTVLDTIIETGAKVQGRKKNVTVCVRAVGTNLCITEVGDFYRDAFARPIEIFADRDGEKPGVGHEPGSGLMAMRAPGPGREVNMRQKETLRAGKWNTALADQVGAQPHLKAITIFADWCLQGLQFEYADDTVQTFGHVESTSDEFADEDRVKHRFTFDETDVGIAKIIVRSGWWIDAIQFVMESGKSTDMVGNLTGGSLSVLVPPEGRSVVGLCGSFDGWIRSIGIFYDFNASTMYDPEVDIDDEEEAAPISENVDVEPGEEWKHPSHLPPLAYATSKGVLFKAAPGYALASLEIEINYDYPSKTIQLQDSDGCCGGREGDAPLTEFLLDEQKVQDIVDDHFTSTKGKRKRKPKKIVVRVEAWGTNGRSTNLADFYRDAFARPIGIFADREGQELEEPGKGDERGPGILAMRVPGRGEDDDIDNAEDDRAHTWTCALADSVGARPRLSAITIFGDWSIRGFRFEYSDGTAQAFGNVSTPNTSGDEQSANEDVVKHRFTFEPETDGEIDKIVVRSGCWIDAIQFVMKNGKSTDMVGNLTGGSLSVLIPPEGTCIVGLYGTCNEWIRSIGILHDTDPSIMDVSSPARVETWKQWANLPSRTYAMSRKPDLETQVPEDYSRDPRFRPIEIFADREGEIYEAGHQRDSGIMVFPAPGVGSELPTEETQQPDGGNKWIIAFADRVGERPSLAAITVFVTADGEWPGVCGLRFGYSDNTTQVVADVSASNVLREGERLVEHRFTFDQTDGGIAKIVIRCGAWMDAIQFVMESGKSTDMVGNLTGGNLSVLVPPEGNRIVGFYGTSREYIRSAGIFYEAAPPTSDVERWSKLPPLVNGTVDKSVCMRDLINSLRAAHAPPVEIFADREGKISVPGRERGPGLMAQRTPGQGREVHVDEMQWEDDVDEWTFAFANHVGERPHLRAITIFVEDAGLSGVRFEYSDNTTQAVGDVSDLDPVEDDRPSEDDDDDDMCDEFGNDYRGRRIEHRFTFEQTDGAIAKIVLRSGCWIDAIQFVMESGKSTDMVGNLDGGSLGELVPPAGKRIVGLYACSEHDVVCALGVYHDA
ncbi:unnamed protein product [Tilletia controversa]|uniref:Jacalin-type lectin domain-containing protein n=3 Tax=Tilletia TaxID=13289 RepID=A0A8X7T0J1_9BASI|nr:hypothetical protein CF336_g1178 [Tilletia laevis]KAE8204898.1 hypothetical protein CF328_g813 [Tilletia controversa]KAE8264642.1 hypothetical protein A4X03_0g800 [Tilletia caries]KAE8208088.1 hypothetical protein CF335_g674 [Tilletia laevis]KAE8254109.1 hypothetical protein A4X06_0g1062 [Tilletia controversa]